MAGGAFPAALEGPWNAPQWGKREHRGGSVSAAADRGRRSQSVLNPGTFRLVSASWTVGSLIRERTK